MTIHFFTGFPGFIATEIIKQLIKEEKMTQLYVLVQDSEKEKADSKASDLMLELDVAIPFEVLVGDITLPNLGIHETELNELQEEKLTVWHLAAIYDLAVEKEIAWKVNVEGTRMVCDFVQSHPSIERFMYFSTAYVAGVRHGNLLETELIRPTGFKNHYEETKYEAELLVEALKPTVPVTIIRPGVVRGHSKTGETIKFDGPYFFLNMIDRLKWLPVIPYIGKTDACLNVVPIDYIIEASVYLSSLKEAAGCTVHLTDPNPLPIETVYRAMVIELTGKLPKGRIPKALAEKSLGFKTVQRKLGVERETLDYLTWDASFDTTLAESLLQGSGVRCANFIESIPTMTDFYKVHKNNPDYHIKI